MADIPYARWYDEGTAAFTKGSTTVTGTNTFWISAGVKAGDIFIDPTGKIYEIASVDSSTQITLRKTYAGETGTGKGYSIIRMFSSTMNATLANQLATLLNEFERRYDIDMQTVTPKSAYDLAKDNGFNGTQAEWLTSLSAYGLAVKNGYSGTITEWLESLKADNEWSTLDSRTNILTYHNTGTHNAIYRGKDLGSVFTDAQKAAIQAGTFDDLYLGDQWNINGEFWEIMGFDYHLSWYGGAGETIDGVNMLPWQNKHHVVIRKKVIVGNWGVPETSLYWLSNQTRTSYKDSNYFVNIRPGLIEKLEGFFGSDHMYKWKDWNYICNANGLYTGGSFFCWCVRDRNCVECIGQMLASGQPD